MAHFLDTNILCYALTRDPKRTVAEALLRRDPVISAQVLNELTNVGRKKLGLDWSALDAILTQIIALTGSVQPLTLETHALAVSIAQRHQLHIYDANIIAAALLAGCDTLYSEDMQDRMVIENRLTIRNPFAD